MPEVYVAASGCNREEGTNPPRLGRTLVLGAVGASAVREAVEQDLDR